MCYITKNPHQYQHQHMMVNRIKASWSIKCLITGSREIDSIIKSPVDHFSFLLYFFLQIPSEIEAQPFEMTTPWIYTFHGLSFSFSYIFKTSKILKNIFYFWYLYVQHTMTSVNVCVKPLVTLVHNLHTHIYGRQSTTCNKSSHGHVGYKI